MYDRWSSSRHNLPDLESFMLVKNRSNELPSLEKKMIMLFEVLRCDQDHDLNDLLDINIRTSTASFMRDSGERFADGSVSSARK